MANLDKTPATPTFTTPPVSRHFAELFHEFGFKPQASAVRPRKPTITDLELLVDRYRKLYALHNDRHRAQRAQEKDPALAPLTGDFALYAAYDRLAAKLEETINAAYAKVGRYHRQEELSYVSEVSMAVFLSEAVARLTYMTLTYSEYPEAIAQLQREVALLQSYFGVFTVALSADTSENLFGE